MAVPCGRDRDADHRTLYPGSRANITAARPFEVTPRLIRSSHTIAIVSARHVHVSRVSWHCQGGLLFFAVSVLLLFAGMSAPHGPVLAAGLALSGLSEGWLTK